MSDALTDIVRDQRRAAARERFYQFLYKHLKGEAAYEEVEINAADCDAIPRGYWNGRSNLSLGLASRVDQLKRGNQNAWLELLWENRSPLFHAISPFAHVGIIFVRYQREEVLRYPSLEGRYIHAHWDEIKRSWYLQN